MVSFAKSLRSYLSNSFIASLKSTVPKTPKFVRRQKERKSCIHKSMDQQNGIAKANSKRLSKEAEKALIDRLFYKSKKANIASKVFNAKNVILSTPGEGTVDVEEYVSSSDSMIPVNFLSLILSDRSEEQREAIVESWERKHNVNLFDNSWDNTCRRSIINIPAINFDDYDED